MTSGRNKISRRRLLVRGTQTTAGVFAAASLACAMSEDKKNAQYTDGRDTGLKIGIAKVDFTPSVGMPMAGNYRGDDYGSRGIHDPLCSRALVAQDKSGNKVAMLTCDVCNISGELANMMRKHISDNCDIASSNILVHATHTHAGPQTKSDDSRVQDFLRKASTAVIEADKDLKPATLCVGHSSEGRLSFNRRLRCKDGSIHMNWEVLGTSTSLDPETVVGPTGPKDPQVTTVSIRRDGRLIGSIVNFGNHPAILAGDNWLYSADYPGYLAEAMKKFYGDDFMTLFFNGFKGNINHIDYSDPNQGRGYMMTQRNGYMLAAAAFEAIRNEKCIEPGPVAASSKLVKLERIKISDERHEWSKEIIEHIKREGEPPHQVDGIPDASYARQWVKLRDIQDQPDKLEVQALRIGPIGIIGMGGEMFNEFGSEIKTKSPADFTMTFDLCNDTKGYFPTKESFKQGPGGFTPMISGYETTPGTTRYAPGAGEVLTASALRQLGRLFA